MDKNILDEQINYYRARAPEYDESIAQLEDAVEAAPLDDQGREFAQMIETVRALPPTEHILELAGGTGIWTKELVKIAESVTVVDASPEMIAINQKKVGSDRVQYRLANLFDWRPDAQVDFVF